MKKAVHSHAAMEEFEEEKEPPIEAPEFHDNVMHILDRSHIKYKLKLKDDYLIDSQKANRNFQKSQLLNLYNVRISSIDGKSPPRESSYVHERSQKEATVPLRGRKDREMLF